MKRISILLLVIMLLASSVMPAWANAELVMDESGMIIMDDDDNSADVTTSDDGYVDPPISDGPGISGIEVSGPGAAGLMPEGVIPAASSNTADEINEYEQFVIGATTKLSGDFFTNMWGNNTCDIDVRSTIHGYSPVVWTMQSRFELDPQVVQSVTVAELVDGGKEYMITINRDLTYNDGTPITARDYVFSMMMFADPVLGELDAITTNSGFIAGADEYRAGIVPYLDGLRIVDDYTYRVYIKAEYLPFFFELAMIDAIPYPISVIAPGCEVADDGLGAYIRNIDQSQAPLWNAAYLTETILDPDTGYRFHPYVTAGPWKLTGFDWDTREATFSLNSYYKGYYDGQKPTIDNLVFTSVLPADMIQRYRDGEIQILNKVVAGENIMQGIEMIASGIANMDSYPRMGLGFISFACEQGPMQFEAVRKAIAYSMDREEYKDEYTMSFGWDVQGYYGLGQWMVQMILGTLMPDGEVSEEDQAMWDAITAQGLSALEVYTTDLDKAEQLLIDDGWTLNETGGAYVKGTDDVRYKRLDDGSLMGLNLAFAQMEGSIAAQLLLDRLTPALNEIGITLDVTIEPLIELLKYYYRQNERTYDCMYLATNFISIFDPYFVFNTDDAYQGTQNTTGFRDPELERLALELRQTPQGALLEYCRRWLAFQDYFNEKLPMLPLYSNVYFDFFVNDLYGYSPNAEMNWPVALLYATIGLPPLADGWEYDENGVPYLVEERELGEGETIDDLDLGDDMIVVFD